MHFRPQIRSAAVKSGSSEYYTSLYDYRESKNYWTNHCITTWFAIDANQRYLFRFSTNCHVNKFNKFQIICQINPALVVFLVHLSSTSTFWRCYRRMLGILSLFGGKFIHFCWSTSNEYIDFNSIVVLGTTEVDVSNTFVWIFYAYECMVYMTRPLFTAAWY